MPINYLRLRASTRSEPATTYCYRDIKRTNHFKLMFYASNLQRRCEKDQFIEIRTQPDIEGQFHHVNNRQYHHSKNGSIQRLEQYYLNNTEEIEAEIEKKELKLKKIDERRSHYDQKIQSTMELIEKEIYKLNQLKSQIKKENFKLVIHEDKLAKLLSLETTLQILQEIKTTKKNILRGQTKIKNLKLQIEEIEEDIKNMEKEIQEYESEKRQVLQEYKQFVKMRNALNEYHMKLLIRTMIQTRTDGRDIYPQKN